MSNRCSPRKVSTWVAHITTRSPSPRNRWWSTFCMSTHLYLFSGKYLYSFSCDVSNIFVQPLSCQDHLANPVMTPHDVYSLFFFGKSLHYTHHTFSDWCCIVLFCSLQHQHSAQQSASAFSIQLQHSATQHTATLPSL